jgi:hypothetical protein
MLSKHAEQAYALSTYATQNTDNSGGQQVASTTLRSRSSGISEQCYERSHSEQTHALKTCAIK